MESSGISEAKERRRLQNRIAQRNHRRRKANLVRVQRDSSTSTQPTLPNLQTAHAFPQAQGDVRESSQTVSSVYGPTSLQPVTPPASSLPTHAVSTADISQKPPLHHMLNNSSADLLYINDTLFGDAQDLLSSHLDNVLDLDPTPEAAVPTSKTSINLASSHAQSGSASASGAQPSTNESPGRRRTSRGGSGGWNPLHGAIKHGHLSIIRLLLRSGANIDAKDARGYTALYLASERGDTEAVKLLLSWGADVLLCDDDGQSCLYVSAVNGHGGIVELLLDHGADPDGEVIGDDKPI